jgi:hypothetical protein
MHAGLAGPNSIYTGASSSTISGEREREKGKKKRKENGNESKLFGLIVSIFLWGRLDISKKKKEEEKELVDVLGGREKRMTSCVALPSYK